MVRKKVFLRVFSFLLWVKLISCQYLETPKISVTHPDVQHTKEGPVYMKPCKLPYGEVCVDLLACEKFVNLLDSVPKPLSKKHVHYIKEHQCEVKFHARPKVCCFRNNVILSTQNAEVKAKIWNAPKGQFEQHKNFNALPHDICGKRREGATPRIYGGTNASITDFPWMVQLLNFDKTVRCGGTFITAKYILTAAHCLTNQKEDFRLFVQAGTTERTPINGAGLPIESVYVYHDFEPNLLLHDIGLIKLKQAVDFSTPAMRPICLPLSDHLQSVNLTGVWAVVTGWGASNSGKIVDSVLEQVTIPVYGLDVCAQLPIYAKYYLNEDQICAGGTGGFDSCQGDSGGPLMVPQSSFNGRHVFVQYGIVSFGYACGEVPSIYTRVDRYLPWILDHLGI